MKKCLESAIVGGLMVYVYMTYKDGSMERCIKNIKPKLETMMDEMMMR